MSLERIAQILDVDECNIMHGPRGVALYVRVGETWHGNTIDNHELGKGKHRLERMTKSLVEVADGLNKSLGRRRPDLRKSAFNSATAAAIEADRVAWTRRANQDLYKSRGEVQQQVQRVDPGPATSFAPAPVGESVSEPMAGRFAAIMAELGDL